MTRLLKQKRPETGQMNQELLSLNPELSDDQLLLKLFNKINEISKNKKKKSKNPSTFTPKSAPRGSHLLLLLL